MRHFFNKSTGYVALAAALLAPVSLGAVAHKRTPELPAKADARPLVVGADKAKLKKLMRDDNAIEPVKFIPEGHPENFMRLAKAKKHESLVEKATRAASNEFIGNIYGVAIGNHSDAFWGKIDLRNGSVTPVYSNHSLNNSADPEHQTGAVRDGILYIPEGVQSSIRDFDVHWKRMDLATGEMLPPLNFLDDAIMWAQAICYDPVTDTFVGMAVNDDNPQNLVANRIVRYNPNKNFEPTIIADFGTGIGEIYNGFFYNPSDKQVYAYREDGRIDVIDRDNNTFTQAAQVTCEDLDDDRILLAPFNSQGSLNLVYSPKDKLVYTSAVDFEGRGENYLFFIDLEAGGYAERVCMLDGTSRLAALYCADSFALPEAAGTPEITAFNLAGSNLSGSVDFKAPTTYYNDLALDKNVTTIATIDGKEVYRQTLAPGAAASFNFTVEEGAHTLDIRCDISDDLAGPVITRRFFAGNDTPKAPTAVNVNDNVITWTAPGDKGVNGGYVDTADLTYDIYIGSAKQNAQPVKGTTFTFDKPESLRQTDIKVTASAHGKTSDFSEAVPVIIGNSLHLPYSATPTAAEASLYTVVDANGDGSTFGYDRQESCFTLTVENYQGSNDWLVLPLMNFDSADRMYKIDATLMNQTPFYGTENVGIYIGKEPEHLDTQIAYYPSLSAGEYEYPVSLNFSVPEAGDYYIGFHARTADESSGVKIFALNVEKLDNSTDVPSALQNIEMVADPLGANKAIFNVTIPSKNVAGDNLDPSKNVTVYVENTSPKVDYQTTGTAMPGEKISITADAEKGFNTFRIYATNSEGDGPSSIVRGYVGLDTPKAPENVRYETCEDNLSMNIFWDPVTEGLNGGYIDPSTVKYQIWNNSQGVTWYRVGDPVSDTKVNFNPYYTTPARWRLAVLAENRDGDFWKQSRVNAFSDQLGTPVSLPLNEDFAITGNKYPWHYSRDTDATEWSSFVTYSTSDLPVLGVGNPTTDDGSVRVLSSYIYGMATEAHLFVPKFSTINMDHPVFLMRIWNYQYAPRFEIYARCFGQEELEKVAEAKPEEYEMGAWRDFSFEIPEKYTNKSWVQFQIHFWLPAAGTAHGVIDKIMVHAGVDHDYKVESVTGPENSIVGEEAAFRVTCTNGGLEPGKADVKVSLYGDGKFLDCRTFALPNLRSFRSLTRQVTFTALTEYTQYEKLEVRAQITGEEDAIPSNDEMVADWNVQKKNVPTVNDLSGRWNEEHNTPILSWSKPDTRYSNHEDFELLTPWDTSEKLGQWKNYDEDKLLTFAVSGLADSWPKAGDKKGWQVVDAELLGTLNDPDLCGHSGKRYLAAFAGYIPDSSQSVQVADWLISPEVVGGTEVTLWLNNISKDYRETLHIMYSTTDDNPESFRKLCNLSKQGNTNWEQGGFTLPADAKYFALKYVGWDTLGILIDDIEYTPVDIKEWAIDGFDIYRRLTGSEEEFTKVGTTTDLSFIDQTCGDANVHYYIVTRASIDGTSVTGPASNVVRNLYATSIGDIAAIDGVSGEKAAILFSGLDGKKAAIYGTDGKLVKAVSVVGSDCRVAMQPGIYIVKVGNIATKVVVK